jgi:hypothetical protein
MDETDSARLLFMVGTLAFIVLGGTHALAALGDAFRPRLFTPRDDEVRRAMMATTLVLTERLNLWRSWIGFNITHGLGLVVFGLISLLVALEDFQLTETLEFMMPIAVAVSMTYALLAVRFFYYLAAGVAMLGSACFIISYVLL